MIVAVEAQRTPPNSSSQEPVFYREFLAEREEILKNKWYLSETAGHDVGFDAALIDWVTRHRQRWIAERRERLSSTGSIHYGSTC